MNPGQQWCDNPACPDSGRVGAGNIKVFSYVERRYYCATCRRTFSEDRHTFFETLRCPRATVLEALSPLVERNSLRAAARPAHHSPNRVLHWLALAGQHGASVSVALVRDLHLTQVQIDELRTFVKKSKPTAGRKTPPTSATCGSGAPWPFPAGCAWSAISATSVASRKHGHSWPNSRPGPMAGRLSSPATNFRRMSPR
jgi:transposase-like protein